MSKVGLLAQHNLVPCGKMCLKPPAWLLPSPGGSNMLQVTWVLTQVSEAHAVQLCYVSRSHENFPLPQAGSVPSSTRLPVVVDCCCALKHELLVENPTCLQCLQRLPGGGYRKGDFLPWRHLPGEQHNRQDISKVELLIIWVAKLFQTRSQASLGREDRQEKTQAKVAKG